MPENMVLRDLVLQRATEITVAAVTNSPQAVMQPGKVTDLLDQVAKKLMELYQIGREQS
jgi:hypothetical protein